MTRASTMTRGITMTRSTITTTALLIVPAGLRAAVTYVNNITSSLAQNDPSNLCFYNREAYTENKL